MTTKPCTIICDTVIPTNDAEQARLIYGKALRQLALKAWFMSSDFEPESYQEVCQAIAVENKQAGTNQLVYGIRFGDYIHTQEKDSEYANQ